MKKTIIRTEKIKELPQDWYRISTYCISNNLHNKTIYTVCTTHNMAQMLDTMRDHTIKSYQLHQPTLDFMCTESGRNEINNVLGYHKISKRVPIL